MKEIALFPTPVIKQDAPCVQPHTHQNPKPAAKQQARTAKSMSILKRAVEALDLLEGTFREPVKVYVDPPTDAAPSKKDESLVLLSSYSRFSFNNRWENSNEVIDYSTIRFHDWKEGLPMEKRMLLTEMQCKAIKRIKIHEISILAIINLLDNFYLLPSVEHLEIDKLVMVIVDKPLDRTFPSLRMLSIESIKFIDIERESAAPKWRLTICAPKLKTVFLGERTATMNRTNRSLF